MKMSKCKHTVSAPPHPNPRSLRFPFPFLFPFSFPTPCSVYIRLIPTLYYAVLPLWYEYTAIPLDASPRVLHKFKFDFHVDYDARDAQMMMEMKMANGKWQMVYGVWQARPPRWSHNQSQRHTDTRHPDYCPVVRASVWVRCPCDSAAACVLHSTWIFI